MGLDPQTRQVVFEMVELMNSQGKTILLVEQNARAGLKLSSHGVVLENGIVRLDRLRPRGARASGDRRPVPRWGGGVGRDERVSVTPTLTSSSPARATTA